MRCSSWVAQTAIVGSGQRGQLGGGQQDLAEVHATGAEGLMDPEALKHWLFSVPHNAAARTVLVAVRALVRVHSCIAFLFSFLVYQF
jgi:hypothetical protein